MRKLFFSRSLIDKSLPLLVIGAGGHGQVVADVARLMGYTLAGFLDDNPDKQMANELILGPISNWRQHLPAQFVLAIGNNLIRARIYQALLADGAKFSVLIHPSAIFASDVSLAAGSVAIAGVIVNPAVRIGCNVILNTACSVDHHCIIEDHVHLAPGVRLGGNVHIGTGTLIGIGALVLPGIRIGKWATVGAGAVVTKDVPDGVTVVGIPATNV